jgi:hypothetical protein
MRNETIEAKSKGQVVATADISMPENLGEMVDMFGEENVFKKARQQYVIGEKDRIRREATEGFKIPKAIKDKLRAMDPNKRAEAASLLDIPEDALAQLIQ